MVDDMQPNESLQSFNAVEGSHDIDGRLEKKSKSELINIIRVCRKEIVNLTADKERLEALIAFHEGNFSCIKIGLSSLEHDPILIVLFTS